MDTKMDASAKLEAIQQLKELMKRLEMEQFAPKSLKVQEVEIEPGVGEEIEDEDELAKLLGD
jgi:hypothetical protein